MDSIIAKRRNVVINTEYKDIPNYIYKDVEIVTYIPPVSETDAEYAGNGRARTIIPGSRTYIAPADAVDNTINVTLVGGKGSDTPNSIGEPGEVLNNDIVITPGEEIPVFIGKEGINGSNGEPSSFGSYMIANGGSSSNSNKRVSLRNDTSNGYAIISYTPIEEVAV